ncbi:MAG: hypothetical protein EPN92_07875 [Chitinophagaceae bacterium]|nr:MAG: hypothetical protein EPN92_07875 [Chitinophagaceae bacterium]
MDQEKKLTEAESLALITQMINKAKNYYHDTGIGAMMWGAVIAVCSLVKLSEIQFGFRLPFDIYLLTLAAIIPQIFITIKEKKERKVKSYDDVYMDYLWLSFGICIFLLILIINNIYADLGPMIENYKELAKGRIDWIDFRFSEFVSPLFLLLYGFPTFVTGAACKFKPMLWGGIFCWACSVITIYTSLKTDLLMTAASAITAWLIPGILMEREYRIYKKSQAGMDV